MDRARRHQRLLSALAFGLLALAAELFGRSLTHRVDVGQHVATPSYSHADYYPFLLVAVKVGVALLLVRLLWRVVKARSAEAAGLRVLGGSAHLPRMRFQLSARLWLTFFVLTSVIFLIQNDAENAAAGRWPLLSPWLHSSALPAFAVISVVCALAWSAVRSWLADYEEHAQAIVARAALRLAGRAPLSVLRPRAELVAPPRRIFGLSFESRPPPLAA
jgi:hypothetical protein